MRTTGFGASRDKQIVGIEVLDKFASASFRAIVSRGARTPVGGAVEIDVGKLRRNEIRAPVFRAIVHQYDFKRRVFLHEHAFESARNIWLCVVAGDND